MLSDGKGLKQKKEKGIPGKMIRNIMLIKSFNNEIVSLNGPSSRILIDISRWQGS